jgi:OOP family OmpA-OmpF porin
MRLRAITFVLIALAGAAGGAQSAGERAAAWVERATLEQVAEGLAAAGEDWARAEADGLLVTLSGAAPDEARRLRAAEILRRIVDPRRVRDATTLADATPLAPPPFALDLLRADDEVTLVGLAPAGAARGPIQAALTAAGLTAAPADMLETVAHPAPAGWDAALDFGLAALARLPQARVSVGPGRVEIEALAGSAAERDALAAELRAATPSGVVLALRLAAPLPVIAPFRMEFALGPDGPRLTRCSAETEADAATIAAAAGAAAEACALGLGAPSPDWASVATAGIAAARALGAGRFALSDLDALLSAPEGVPQARLGAAADRLRATLPDAFSLRVAGGGPAPDPAAAAAASPPEARLEAVLAPDGAVRLSGPAPDAATRDAIASFAAALFGHDRVSNELVVAAALPEGWPGRVLAGVEALSLLKEGRLAVTPQAVRVDGWARSPDGAAQAEALLAAKSPGAAEIAVRFDAAAAAAEARDRARAEDPAGACAGAVAAILAEGAIAFQPGSAELQDAGSATVAALAAAFADCPPLDFEIAGHTDSAGAADRNQALSEARAEAVRAALEAADLPHMRFQARGYGADQPIADNATEEGRAANRRIAFTLIPERAPAQREEPRVGPR